MNKLILISLVTVSLLLTGCETASQLNTMRTSAQPVYSCEQIVATFKAYEMDKQSVTAIAAMSGFMPAESNVDTASEGYYQRAKSTANIALIAQGCPPLA